MSTPTKQQLDLMAAKTDEYPLDFAGQARAALNALGAERMWAVQTADGCLYSVVRRRAVAKETASGFGLSPDPRPALLIVEEA